MFKEEKFREDSSGSIGQFMGEEVEEQREGAVDEPEKIDVEIAIKRIRNGKAGGGDGIAPEMMKYGGKEMIEWLTDLFKQIWREEKVPVEWTKENILIPIHKKGNTNCCENYRPVCLAPVALKILTRILERKIRELVEDKIEEEQMGFRPGRQTQDGIHIVRNLIEKRLDKGKEVYMAYLDLKSAFDKVPRRFIWEAMKSLNIPNKLIRLTKAVYENVGAMVRLNGQKSESFKMESGVKQGDSLSPLLFIIYLDHVHKKVKKKSRPMCVGYNRLRPEYIQDLIYADDIAVISNSRNNLQHAIEIWEEELTKTGMEINADKSKVLIVSKSKGKEQSEAHIECRGRRLEVVEEVRYLGVIINKKGKLEAEIHNRATKAANCYHSINRSLIGKKEVPREAKMAIYRTVYEPTLTYGSETWKARVTAMEMKFLRRIVGKTRRDKIRNSVIREELNEESIIERIEKKQLKWYGHVQRMEETRLTKRVTETKVQGRRARGRPRKSWEEQLRGMMMERGKTEKQVRGMVQDRVVYRRWVEAGPNA
jgi:hypothetical protein